MLSIDCGASSEGQGKGPLKQEKEWDARVGEKTLSDGHLHISPLVIHGLLKGRDAGKPQFSPSIVQMGKLMPREGKRPTHLVAEPEPGSRVLEDQARLLGTCLTLSSLLTQEENTTTAEIIILGLV